MPAVPIEDLTPLCLGHGELGEKPIDVILMNRDVLNPQPDEVAGLMDTVIVDQDMPDHVPHVEDRPVDIEDDHQLIVRMALPDGSELIRERPHPVGPRKVSCGRFVARDHLVRSGHASHPSLTPQHAVLVTVEASPSRYRSMTER